MKKQLITICCLIVGYWVFGQDYPKEYIAFKKIGNSLYKIKEYKRSAIAYTSALRVKGWDPTIDDRWATACSWSLGNFPDSAFSQLNSIAVSKDLTLYYFDHIINDKDFTPLHNDKRWQKVKDKMFVIAKERFLSTLTKAPDKDSTAFRMEAAIGWTLLNNSDSAFYQLKIIADSKDLTFENVDAIIHNDVFLSVEKDKRWQNYTNKMYSTLYKKYFPISAFGNTSVTKHILIDEGHHNGHTITGTYAALAGTLKKAGFKISAHTGEFNAASLADADLVIIANPFPDVRDSLVARADRAGEPFRWSAAAAHSAFTESEVTAIQNWVRNGGALLLILDHAPHGKTGGLVAAAFGVECRNVATYDRTSRDPEVDTTVATTILFTRSNGLIGEHPILNGVDSVTTYTGESLLGPPKSAVLLALPSTATDMDWEASTQKNRNRSSNGRAQGIALEYGRGRVVVLGEAAMTNSEATSRNDRGNWQMTLNILKWLTGNLK